MKYILLIVACLCFSSSLFAWTEFTGNIRGIVTNLESGQIIRGATIHLVPFDDQQEAIRPIMKAFSQDVGEFLFKNVPPGLYNLECKAFGFKTTRLVGVQIREDRTKLAYFKLSRGLSADIDEVYTYASLEAQQKATTQTSTATEESLGDAPATIYVVSAEDIEDRGYMSLDEVLQDIPEMEIQRRHSTKEFNTFSARGIANNNRLLILVDGHRFNSMVSSQYTIGENYNIRYAKRIEVIIGPASALYGADAFMGVVNIITKSGNESKGVSLTSSYGLYNTTHNAFQLGVGNETISFSLTGGFYYSDGPPLNTLYPQDFEWYNDNYLNKGELRSSPSTPNQTVSIPIRPFNLDRSAYFVGANFKYKKFSLNIQGTHNRHSSATGRIGDYSPYWDDVERGNALVTFNLAQQFIPKASKKWSLKTELDGSLNFITGTSKTYNTFSNYQDFYQAGSDLGTRLTQSFNYIFNKNNLLTVGIFGQYAAALPPVNSLPNRPNGFNHPFAPIDAVAQDLYYPGTDHTDSDGNSLKIYRSLYYLERLMAGAFAEYRLNIKNKFILTVGARYDQVQDRELHRSNAGRATYFSVSPRIGMVYKPTKNWNFKLFYGEGFLQPPPELKYDQFGSFQPVSNNSGDISHLQGDVWRVPNTNLLPEYVQSLETSTRYSKGDFSIAANLYFNRLEGWITYETRTEDASYRGIPLEVAQYATNSDKTAFAYGGTIRADYRIVGGKEEQLSIKINASYSYTDGSLEGFEELPFNARHTIKSGLLTKFKHWSWHNSFSYRSVTYNAGIENNAGEFIQASSDPFFLWNSFLRYRFLKKEKWQLSAFAKVTNVLNSRYYNVTDNTVISMGRSPQDPIRFVLGISMNFGRGL
jgi:iron complex outermembrane receptor protein